MTLPLAAVLFSHLSTTYKQILLLKILPLCMKLLSSRETINRSLYL